MALLELPTSPCPTPGRALKNVSMTVEPRRDRHAHRRQRAGKTNDIEDHLRLLSPTSVTFCSPRVDRRRPRLQL